LFMRRWGTRSLFEKSSAKTLVKGVFVFIVSLFL